MFNATRIKYLQLVALGLSCLSSDRQPTPVYSSAFYSIDGKADEGIEVPGCLLNIELGNSVKQLPFLVVKRSFGSVEKVGVVPDPKRVGPASQNLEYG